MLVKEKQMLVDRYDPENVFARIPEVVVQPLSVVDNLDLYWLVGPSV
jgi:hypothetical protein